MSSRIFNRTTIRIGIMLMSVTFSLPTVSGQELSLESSQALEEWRWGVVSYNDGLPGKSLLAMERALALNPTDARIGNGWAAPIGNREWRTRLSPFGMIWRRIIWHRCR
jgi:hypothetical protein